MSKHTTSPAAAPFSKAEILLSLGLHAYDVDSDEPTETAHLQIGFEALLDLARRCDGIPPADVNEFQQKCKDRAPIDTLMVTAVLLATFIPDAEFYALLVQHEVEIGSPPASDLHPKFVEACMALEKIRDEEGDRGVGSAKNAHLFRQMFDFAPEPLQQQMLAKARETGLIPKPTHVDDQGRPMFSAEQLAAQFGGTVDDVRRFAEEIGLRESDLYAGPVHPLQ